ncbi:hypothetical protein QVD17_41970 [Tagetes erecta]|uniref:VQ domain-containing protein n=1 Tax=Tagetes erecta TaxID=13708 RepID=A0AAD8JL70_TARER|nr:hypothetical protein QVD17_41970 [Tagetes erecta]
MSLTRLHAKQEHDNDQKPLNINQNYTFLHRLPPSPTARSSTAYDTVANKTQPPPPPPPVIIYTHSPKVIHTHPRDFMALVQKLTGYTPSKEETQPTEDQDRRQRQEQGNMEDNESSSGVTEEHGSSVNDVPQVNSCFVDHAGVGVAPPPYKVAGFDPCYNPAPAFRANSTNFLCAPTHQLPFYNHDSMLLNRNSLSSSSSLRALRGYPDI